MKTILKISLIVVFQLFALTTSAQEWMDLLQNPNSTYDDIVQSAEAYYNANPELKDIKGSGYKDFQRF